MKTKLIVTIELDDNFDPQESVDGVAVAIVRDCYMLSIPGFSPETMDVENTEVSE